MRETHGMGTDDDGKEEMHDGKVKTSYTSKEVNEGEGVADDGAIKGKVISNATAAFSSGKNSAANKGWLSLML